MKSMILAADRNGWIGLEGELPWPHIAEDMAWFKHVTMRHKRCIMGRKTWESIGKLKGRECHVVTSCGVLERDGADAVHTSPPPLEDGDIVIGGASLYEHYIDQVDAVFLTEVDGVYYADTKVNLKHLLSNQMLRGYMITKDCHVINAYTKRWDVDECIHRRDEIADKAIGMLADFPEDAADESPVDSPSHYTQGGIETIDAIGAITAGYDGEDAFCAGNVAKYIARAPFKDNKAEDLQKALWYLKRLIDGGDNDC